MGEAKVETPFFGHLCISDAPPYPFHALGFCVSEGARIGCKTWIYEVSSEAQPVEIMGVRRVARC